MKKTLVFISLLVILVSCSKREVKVACVGDSITAGATHKYQSKTAYPVVLGQILGDDYSVINCGRSSATLLKDGNLPYWRCNEFSNVFAYKPNIITIKLGTNDTKPRNWNSERFESDYQSLIDTFLTISPQPQIYVCLPVPVFKLAWGINDSTVTNGVIPIIKHLAEKNNLPIIDLYQALKPYSPLFSDGVHPNEEGAKIIAETIAKKIK